jgi:guanine nucleotide-binding protein subunit alpha
MRVIHNDKFNPQEIETYRQLVFNNIVRGLQMLVDSLPSMGLSISSQNTVRLLLALLSG